MEPSNLNFSLESSVLTSQTSTVANSKGYCERCGFFQEKLIKAEKEIKRCHEQINLMKAIMHILKDDLNLKNEQFDYLFNHFFRPHKNSSGGTSNDEEYKSAFSLGGLNLENYGKDNEWIPQIMRTSPVSECTNCAELEQKRVEETMTVPITCLDATKTKKEEPQLKHDEDNQIVSQHNDENYIMIQSNTNRFQYLPFEVMLMLVSYLDGADICRLMRVNREFQRLGDFDDLWRHIFTKKWTSYLTFSHSQNRLFSHINTHPIDPQPSVSLPSATLNSTTSLYLQAPLSTENHSQSTWRDRFAERYSLDKRWVSGRPVVSTLTGHAGSVTSVAYQAYKNKFVTSSDDGCAILWQFEDLNLHGDLFQQHHLQTRSCNRVRTFHGHGGPVWCCELGDESNTLYTGSYDRTVKQWDLDSGACEFTLRGHTEWISALKVKEGINRLFSCGWDACIKVWNLEYRTCIRTFLNQANNAIYCLDISKDASLLAAGCRFRSIELWDVQNSLIVSHFLGHLKRINCVEMNNDVMFSGSADNTIKIWDIRDNSCIDTLSGHSKEVMCLQYDENNQRLISGSYDKTIKIWDLRSNQSPLRDLKGHSSPVFGIRADDVKIISGSSDQTVKIWNFCS
eukprot:CAMPEP_0115022876 /NCGR_PEP_ID=MMETSP0216-20121206/31901_1 /TAXON_ID=223996 /ORGANISM="Protocruzia adherens, Strain Boccale" /LENGTH=623 /DNA_ID=CAMNT_0002395823 /DNA_START=116 /DNA_END=1987 /DNA_ORIENTATION=-